MGLDLGQRRDPSAIAVVERMDLARAYSGTAFHSLRVRHLERVPLGTPYPGVVARGRESTRNIAIMAGRCALAVDGTGVGAGGRYAARGAAWLRYLSGHDHGWGSAASERDCV